MALRVNPAQSYYVPIWQNHVIQMLGTLFKKKKDKKNTLITRQGLINKVIIAVPTNPEIREAVSLVKK